MTAKTEIFDKALTGSFVASNPIMIAGEAVTLDFLAEIATQAAIEWYLEFTDDDPNASSAQWFRELAEETNTGGDVEMPLVVRTFKANGGTNPAAGTFAASAQFVRDHKFCRVQIRVASGSVTRTRIFAQFGIKANSPA